jgi:flagellar biosynthesis/type III secretory pathway M-ring protein FliF/YscJ
VDVGSLLIILVVLCAVVALLYGPLRAHGAAPRDESADRVAELEARKEAKYREIRDAQMDMRTGKLSEQDFRILDRQLRAEAMEILRALDEEPGHVVADHRLG